MREAELEANVADACKKLGLRRYHTHRSEHSPAGFPDDVILGPRGALFRELKRQDKGPTAEQAAWLADLSRLGFDVAVWRPEDWMSGRIRNELLALTTRSTTRH